MGKKHGPEEIVGKLLPAVTKQATEAASFGG